jgi:Tol biopolymer transport system component
MWVELGGPVSNIARISEQTGTAASKFQIEVENGEQPSVSSDGKWLAFIRENRGRGALWIKGLEQNAGPPGRGERKVVDDSYDVWEAAFEPGNRRIILAAAFAGQPELYWLDLHTFEITRAPIQGPARYPAFSPDGKWLAYSRCERGSWHLYVANLTSGSSTALGRDDCNSISPAWEADSKSLTYATDCGRGLNMTALAQQNISPVK